MRLLFLVLLPALVWAQEEIPYQPERDAKASLAAALQSAKAGHKRVWVQIGEANCPACKRLYLFLEAHPSLADLLHQHFLPLHVGISRENIPLFREWGTPQLTHGVPVILILDGEGKILATAAAKTFTASVGEFSEATLLEFLHQWKAPPPPAP